MVDRFWQDFALAVRNLLRGGLVSAIAVLSLALGIGANTTVFSLVQALEFPHLIYPDAGRIVFLETKNEAEGIAEMMMSGPDAGDVARASRLLQGSSVSASQSSILRAGDQVRRIQGRRVDSGFFPLMQVPPALGRAVREGDAPGVIVLSDSLWRSQFGADAAIVGAPVHVDGGSVTVIGVMPPLFDGDADFWTPLGSPLDTSPRDDRQFDLFARISPSASLTQVNAELATLSTRLAADHPATNRGWQVYAVPLSRLHGRDAEQSFLLLQAAVAFVLLIACANIANLLLARGADRRREMAVRIALGATRRRLMTSLLVDAVVLAASGGVLGVLLSMWGIRLSRTLLDFPDVVTPQLNVMVLLFAAAVSLATGIICGIAPALRASAVAPDPVLRESGRGTTDRAAGRFRAVLVVVQMAAALMLATCAALLLRSVANREHVALGFEPRGAFRADLALPYDRYGDPDRARQAIEAVIANTAAQADVVAAGAQTWALPTGAGAQRQLTLPERRDAALPADVRRTVQAVTPGYFRAMGIDLRGGRVFTGADRQGGEPVAVINEELARRLWPDGMAIGRSLRLGAPGEAVPVVTVVGVVASTRRSPMHDAPIATVFLPYAQYPNGMVTVVTRTRGDVGAGVRAFTAALHGVDPSLLAEHVKTLDADMAAFTAPLRLVTNVLGAFALTAVVLAAMGIFGTMSYTVVQRQHEMAVRVALGAGRTAIVRLVFGSALRLTVAGVVIGAIGAALATRALQVFLFGVTGTDPVTYAVVAAALPAVALAACWRPARRAARSDPMQLLRQ
jgi:putative ABC transport system permease protein